MLAPELLGELASYLPRLVLGELWRRKAPPPEPIVSLRDGAILLVDITGFTPLASALVERGARGIEQLSRALNTYLARVTDIVHAHGGDVTKIVGDAVLAVWSADDDLGTATRRATACGLAITKALSDVKVDDDIRLSLKVGVCAGGIASAHVGGLGGRWLFVVGGDGTAQLAVVEPQLLTGAVVASPQAWAELAATSVGHQLQGGVVRVASTDAVDPAPAARVDGGEAEVEVLRAYVPIAVLARIDAGHQSWIGELRRSTVAFLDLRGLTAPTVDPGLLQEVAITAQRVLARYDGWLKEITTDEKGTSLVAVFGIPPFTHEDDASRAIHVAALLCGEMRRLGLRAGAGVATGSAFFGPVGGTRRRDLAVLGAHVNLSARLARAAQDDDVLLDAPSRTGSRAADTAEHLPGYLLKGVMDPIDVYRIRTTVAIGRRAPLLVGRVRERSEGSGRLRALAEGRGGVVVLEGEPGIGKTRLVEQWLEDASAVGVRHVVGAAEEIEKDTPYHAWRPVFERIFGVQEPAGQAVARDLATRMDKDDARLLPLLGGVLPLALTDNEVTRHMTGVVRADNTRGLLVRTLARECRRAPLLVLLEDVQWLDPTSWALLEQSIREIGCALFVLTMRPGLGTVGGPEAQVRSRAATIQLGPLSEAETAALAADRMGATTLAPSLAALVQERSEGNPLFIEQLTYAMRDQGSVVVEDGAARLAHGQASGEELSVPLTVQRVITGRIDQLSLPEAQTMRIASAIGRRFSVQTVRDVHPLRPQEVDLRRHLATLTRMELIAADPSSPDWYVFRHVVAQEVAYSSMLPSESAPLHRAIATWYERAYAHDLAPYYLFLARHWERGGTLGKAIGHLERAAERALAGFANQEAIRAIERAILLGGSATFEVDASRRGRWELQLGEAYVHMSRYAEGRPRLEAGLRLAGHAAPRSSVECVARLAAELVAQCLRRAGLSWRRRPGPDQLDAEIRIVRAYERLAEATYYDEDTLLSLYCVVHVLNAAERSGEPAEIARGLAGTGALFGFIPLPRIAEWYLRRALRLVEGVGDLATEEIVRIVAGFYYVGAANWASATSQLDRVQQVARDLGDRRRYDDALSVRLELESLRGSFHVALEIAEELRRSASARGDTRFHAEALLGKAYCYMQTGVTGSAMKCLAEFRTVVGHQRVPVDVRVKHAGLLAAAHLARGERQQAIAASDDVASLTARHRPTNFGAFAGYMGRVDVGLAVAESEPALPELRARAKAALKALNGYSSVFPVGRPRAATMTARYEWLVGDRRRALRTWRAAAGIAEQLDMPLEHGLALLELGRHLEVDVPERAVLLMRARDLLATSDAAPALAAAELAVHGEPRA